MSSRLKILKEQLSFLKTHNASEAEIKELETKIARSKRGKRSRSKGSTYERTIAKKFMARFPKLDLARTPSSGGFKKSANNEDIRGDVSNLNKEVQLMLHLEAKNQVKWNLPEWIKQAKDDCPKGKMPCVVFHQSQLNKDGKRVQEADDFICMRLEDFLKVVEDKSVVKEIGDNVRNRD